jgi:hypothetical protein
VLPNEEDHVVVLTTAPWNEKTLAKWVRAKNQYRADIFRASSFRDAAAFLDAPFLDNDEQHGELGHTNLFLISADARLKRTDADYDAKLKRVLENLKAQVGGDWRVEEKEIVIFQAHVESAK